MPFDRDHSPLREGGSVDQGPYRAIVVIPARNEIDRIGRCLRALAAQTLVGQVPVAVLVLVNGTTDGTVGEALRVAKASRPLDIHVIEANLPRGRRDAGAARQWATRLACGLPAREDAAIFMTDADSVAPRDWLERYGDLLWNRGYDAIAGSVDMIEDAQTQIPPSLMERGQWEEAYEARLDILESWLDPCDHDPWPRHFQASGANIAIRRPLVCGLLDSAWPACGEDKLLIAAVTACDGRVRHDTEIRVATSGRLFGRARGGMADTMRQRILKPDLPCDPRLEALDRACFRARIRRLWRTLRAGAPDELAFLRFAKRLGLPVGTIQQLLRVNHFGSSWQWLETHSPALRRYPLAPTQLPREIARANVLLGRLGVSLDSTPASPAPPPRLASGTACIRLRQAAASIVRAGPCQADGSP